MQPRQQEYRATPLARIRSDPARLPEILCAVSQMKLRVASTGASASSRVTNSSISFACARKGVTTPISPGNRCMIAILRSSSTTAAASVWLIAPPVGGRMVFPATFTHRMAGPSGLRKRRYSVATPARGESSPRAPLHHGDLGLIKRARVYGAQILRARPGYTIAHVRTTETFKDPADLEHLLDGLHKSGPPG